MKEDEVRSDWIKGGHTQTPIWWHVSTQTPKQTRSPSLAACRTHLVAVQLLHTLVRCALEPVGPQDPDREVDDAALLLARVVVIRRACERGMGGEIMRRVDLII